MSKRKYLSYEETKRLLPIETLKEKLQNQTYKEIAAEYGMDQRIVSQLAQKEYGIPKNNKVISRNLKIKFDEQELIELYINKQMSLRQIAEYYNVNHRTVGEKLKSMNIEIRPFNYYKYYDNRKKNNILKYIDSVGYCVLVINGDHIREHRYVIGLHLNRDLLEDETVHHIDFNKTNNDIENLFLFEKQRYHSLYHSYIEHKEYITPSDFIERYKKIIDSIYDYDYMYDMYVKNKFTVHAISKYLSEKTGLYVGRLSLTKFLKETGIYNLLPPTVNQEDDRICINNI